MNIKATLIAVSESLFDRHGFTATGMDKLTRGAGISSRTLYKHAGSKSALIASVLSEREKRFLRRLEVTSTAALFKALEDWVRVEGCRNCLFLRAYGETGGDTPEVAEVVLAHKARMIEKIADIVALETGRADDPQLVEQIVVLFEGATAAAVYRGERAVVAAGKAATTLVQRACV